MTEVDERIVELRFENKQFEQETERSMKTLDRLKEKLQFKNASSGADQLQKAVAKINFNPVIQGIGTIETKMSGLAVAGKRVIENLTDWAMSGVNKVIGKLQGPINQIITGGKSRAMNIEQAKFQLEGLGVAWESIEEDISYGVQDTAYGLDAAAKVASQLVASQVQLGDEMKHALLGISGVAAMTNSSYEDIGRIYTTVAGNGRLMGEQLLQLSSRGINAAAQLAKALNTTEAEVRDMVSKGKISFQMFSDAMFESFGEHAKSANKTFTGALSNTKAALSRLGADVAAQGFNSIRDILNDIIPKLKEFKKQMKPVEDAIISMVDAVGKLIQTLIKAIDIKAIVKKITPPLQTAAEAIGDFAAAYELVFNRKRRDTNDAAFFAEQRGLKRVKESTEQATDAMVKLNEISDAQKQMAKDIWEKGSYGTGQDRVNALKENYEIVQAYVDKMIEFGWDEAKMNEYLAQEEKEHAEAVTKIDRAYKKQLLVENLFKIFGNLKRVAKNVFESLTNIFKVAFSSMTEALEGKSLMEGLIFLTGKLADLSDRFKITEEDAEKLRPIFKALFTIIKYVGIAIGALAKGLGVVIDAFGKLITKIRESGILEKVINGIKDSFLYLKDVVVDVYNRIKNSAIWDRLYNILKNIIGFVGTKAVAAFNGLRAIARTVIDTLVKGFGKVTEKIDSTITSIRNTESPFKKLKNFFTKNILESSWFLKIKDVVGSIFGEGQTGRNLFNKAYEFASQFAKGIVKGLSTMTIEDVEKASIIITLISTTLGFVKWLWSMVALNKGISNLAASLSKFFNELTKTSKAIGAKAKSEAFVNFANSVKIMVEAIIYLMMSIAVLEGLGFDSGRILSFATGIVLSILALNGLIQIAIASLSKSSYLNNAISLGALKLPLTIMGIALMLKSFIYAIQFFYAVYRDPNLDVQKFIITLGTIIGFIGTIFVLIRTLAVHADNSVSMSGIAGIMFSIITLIFIVTSTLKKVYKMVKQDYNSAGTALAYTTAIIGEILIFVTALRAISGKWPTEKGNQFTGLFALVLSMTALIRLGIIPLFEAIWKMAKEGDKGVNAIGYAEEFLQGLFGFIGLLSLGAALLSIASYENLKTGPILAIAGVISAIGLMIGMLAVAINQLRSVDRRAISKFKDLLTVVMTITGVFALLVEVASVAAGPVTVGALLSLAAVFLGLGVAMLGAGVGFKAFETGLREFVDFLPTMVYKLLDFFALVYLHKDELREGIVETVSLMGQSFALAILSVLQTMSDNARALAEAVFDWLIASMNGAADMLFAKGDKVIDAKNHLLAGLLYVITYNATHGINASIADAIKDMIFNGFIDGVINAINLIKDFMVGIGDMAKFPSRAADIFDAMMEKMFPSGTSEINHMMSIGRKAMIENSTLLGNIFSNVINSWMPSSTVDAVTSALDSLKIDNSKRDARLEEMAKEAAERDAQSVTAGLVKGWQAESNEKTLADGLGGLFSGESTGKLKDTVTKYYKQITDSITGINPSETIEGILSKTNSKDIWNNLISGNFDDVSKEYGLNMSEEMFNGFVNGWDGEFDINNPEFAKYLNDFNWEMENLEGEAGYNTVSNWFEEAKKATKDKEESLKKASSDTIDAVVKKIQSFRPKFYKASSFCAEGVADGFADADVEKKALNNVSDLVLKMQYAAEKTAKIKSPSKLFAKVGNYITLGLAEGVSDLSYAAEEATEGVVENSVSSLRQILDRIFDTTMAGLDTNPTITPVLDLSLLEEGLGQMGTLMGSNTLFGLAYGAANGYNRTLASRYATDDILANNDGTNVVEAIDSLKMEVSELRASLDTLGFYVDGRQMATAIADPMSSELGKISVKTGRGVRS